MRARASAGSGCYSKALRRKRFLRARAGCGIPRRPELNHSVAIACLRRTSCPSVAHIFIHRSHATCENRDMLLPPVFSDVAKKVRPNILKRTRYTASHRLIRTPGVCPHRCLVHARRDDAFLVPARPRVCPRQDNQENHRRSQPMADSPDACRACGHGGRNRVCAPSRTPGGSRGGPGLRDRAAAGHHPGATSHSHRRCPEIVTESRSTATGREPGPGHGPATDAAAGNKGI